MSSLKDQGGSSSSSDCLEHSECGICFRPMNLHDGQELVCQHLFHVHCLQKWKFSCEARDIVPSCPFCRKEKLTPVIRIDTPNIFTIPKKREINVTWHEDSNGTIHIDD